MGSPRFMKSLTTAIYNTVVTIKFTAVYEEPRLTVIFDTAVWSKENAVCSSRDNLSTIDRLVDWKMAKSVRSLNETHDAIGESPFVKIPNEIILKIFRFLPVPIHQMFYQFQLQISNWIWQTHWFRPEIYQKDCLRLFHRIIDHSLLVNEIGRTFKEQVFLETCPWEVRVRSRNNEMIEKPLMKEFYICQQNILQKRVIFFLIEMSLTNINCLTASVFAPHWLVQE